MRSNCLFWALGKWWRHGGRVEVSRSRHPLCPRFYWVDRIGNWHRFAPDVPKRGWRGFIHAFWFRGTPRIHRRHDA